MNQLTESFGFFVLKKFPISQIWFFVVVEEEVWKWALKMVKDNAGKQVFDNWYESIILNQYIL